VQYYLSGEFKWAPVYLSAEYSPINFYTSHMAKKSGSSQFGALKNTPTLTLAISSSLIYIVDGVKYGFSVLAIYPYD